MPRVASLYLPFLAIERVRLAERRRQPDAPVIATPPPAPATTGWRPGARWARADEVARVERDVAALPLHQRPAMRELGRRSEAAAVPFRAMPSDEGGAPVVQLPARPRHRPSDPPLVPDGGAALRHAFADPAPGGDAPAPLRQMVRDFPTVPERGRSDRDAGGSRRTPSTQPRGGYEREGAFWQSAHAIAGEVRSGWDDPARPARRLAPRDASTPAGAPPLVTARREGSRLVIAAACPAARALGLMAGQPLASARALVPGLDVRDADPAGDAARLHRLALHAVRHWTPIAAPLDDGLWIEMSAAHLHGGEAALARRILRLLAKAGHDARIAIADTPGAAHALARHGAETLAICPPDAQHAALGPLPVAALRIEPGIEARLRRLGLASVAALAGLPRAPLVRRFGPATAHRLDQALGARAEPIEGVLPPETPQAACGFLEPISTAEAIATALERLTRELCAALAARGLGARRVAMLCRRVDGRDEIETIGTARATREAGHLLRLLAARIERIDPGFGIEAMRLVAPRCDRLGALDHATLEPAAPDLALLVDLLATRLGSGRLYRLAGVESDVPERSVARAAPLGDAPPPHPDWPRPLRLLARPEPLANVIAELPDQPPVRFRWRDTLHAVTRGDGPERIHGEWWRATGEADAVRDYFAVEDDSGRRFWLFRRGDGQDGRTGDMSWHLHGFFGR